MIEIDKNLIKERFAKSIKTYNNNAKSQKQISKTLASYIKKYADKQLNKVLELGAGTGFLTQELLHNIKIQQIVCNDMVGEYEPVLQNIISNYNTDFKFVECDLEQTNNFIDSYDLIASASALQWVVELDALFEKISEKLVKNGIFAFSTFGKNNLIEFREILSQGLFYPDLQMLKDTVSKYFTICDFYEEEIIIELQTPTDVLKHIKYTGVNSLIRSKLTREKLNDFSEKYIEKYSTAQGVKLTYNPIYIIAKNNFI